MKESGIIEKFTTGQLASWPLASVNHRSLMSVRTRELEVGGLSIILQHNPERIRSTAAKVDKDSLKTRLCFLCADNRPEQQKSLSFVGHEGRTYDILLNPYPIFRDHLVIACTEHTDQCICNRFDDMLDLADRYHDFTFFYNGPRCGASAPDHLHFQACHRHELPLENEVDRLLEAVRHGEDPSWLKCISDSCSVIAYHLDIFTRGVFVLCSADPESLSGAFYRLLECAPIPEGEKEPMFNLFTWCHADGSYRAMVMFRANHRSHHYFSEGPDHLTISPGCADMAGLLVVPDPKDFDRLDAQLVSEVLSEVSVDGRTEEEIIRKYTRGQHELHVGIMSGSEIEFELISEGPGVKKVACKDGKVEYEGALYDELQFDAPASSSMFASPAFILHGVTIGVDFHWERRQTQKFAGTLRFIADGGKVTAINIIGVEDYLLSVISSEMKASASLEFLKAHAVISRSWVISQIRNRRNVPSSQSSDHGTCPSAATGIEVRKWFGHEDHTLFDVCADDHCQRYQGLTNAVGEYVRKAIDMTWGEVLTSGAEICDARFSKCCGGVMEEFSTCWEDRDMSYLQALPDTPGHDPSKEAFCNTTDETILRQVLNDYDLETKDFYRWTARYPRAVLADLITRRSGYDIGSLTALTALERGKSGRIKRLRIDGSRLSVTVGKELMIRRWLSESHLKSSAFDIRHEGDDIILEGKGWGHGVGLCQIGAAVMSTRGYSYDDILRHYYPGAEIERR